MNKLELVHYMNEILKIWDFDDDSANGLQVDSSKKDIKKIGYAVDASSYLFEKGVKEHVDMILVHHGLFRGMEKPLIEKFYKKIKVLMDHDIAVYAAHLPLDAHPKLGNNAQLAKFRIDYFKLKKYKIETSAEYRGNLIGFTVISKDPIGMDKVAGFCKKYHLQYNLYNFGNKKSVQSVMFGSGGCGDSTSEAHEKGYDLFILGEAVHRHLVNAKELGQSILIGGHYETEVCGVQALAEHVAKKFGIKTVFLDEAPYSRNVEMVKCKNVETVKE